MPSKRKQGKKSKTKGAGEKAKRKGLKTWLSALHAQTLEVIIIFALGIEAHELLNLQMALGKFLALNSQTVT